MEKIEQANSLGQILKDARVTKGFTLDEVAKVTKIRIEFLKALEDDDYISLPERTYALGYFRYYGNFLGIAGLDKLVEDLDNKFYFQNPEYTSDTRQMYLDDEYSITNIIKKTVKNSTFGAKNNKDTIDYSNNKRSNKLLYLLLFLFIGVFLFMGFNLFNKNEVIEVTQTTNQNKDQEISSVAGEDFVVVDNDKLSESNKKDDFVSQNKESNNVVVDNKENDVSENIGIIYAKWPQATTNVNITLYFSEDVWVQIYQTVKPNIVYLDKIFTAGQSYDIPKVEGISMSVGNYQGVKITVDSKELFFSSNNKYSRVLKNIILDKQLLINRYSSKAE